MSRYFDFLIHVGARRQSGGALPGDYYPVEARLEDGGIFDGGRLELDRVGLNLSALEQDAEAHGRKLSEAIFSNKIDRALHVALGHVQGAGSGYDGLRVRVSIDDEAPELHALGWERLYHQQEDEWRPLATSASSPFSRYIAMQSARPLRAMAGAVRILAVVAHPSGVPDEVLAPIDVAAEIDNLHRALAELPAGRAVQVTFMPGRSGLPAEQRRALEQAGHTIVDGPASLDGIVARLRHGYDVFHFLGHGHFDQTTNTATLHLENETGGWATVTDTVVTNAFRSLRCMPRLVFLSACQSATRAAHDAFVGLAPKLVHAEVPAVVAMQEAVSMEDARTLTRHFYANVLEHGFVDLALNQARSHLHRPDRLDWGIPVLFTRLSDGRLFVPADEHARTRYLFLDALPRGMARWVARGLVLTGVILPFAYWIGALAQHAREYLIGIPDADAFSYSAGDLLSTGLIALPELALYMLTGPFLGVGIERWAVPILAAMGGVAWGLRRRGHVRLLMVALAVLWPVLAFSAVFHAHAARVHHVALGTSACPEQVVTVPEQVRFEVCSWLRNPTQVNEGRRDALAGLGGWFAALLALLTGLSVAAARRFASQGLGRWLAAGLAALHGLVFVYVLVQVPRVYAMAHWGLKYPRVTEIRRDCATPALREAVANETCQAVDVTSGADNEVLIVWGSACNGASASLEPDAGAGSARMVRLSSPVGMRAGQRCVLQIQSTQTILNRSE